MNLRKLNIYLRWYCGVFILCSFCLSCTPSIDYPQAPAGTTDQALITRVKLALMYYNNNTQPENIQDIYARSINPTTSGEEAVLKNIYEVDQNYSIKILDKTTTSAIVEIRALSDEFTWMGIPSVKEEWLLINNEWRLNKIAD